MLSRNFFDLKKMDNNTIIVVKNMIISFGIKGFSLFLALFTTPAYMNYFGDEKVLGVWFTILSVLTWILNCDMGIGNGLRNKLVNSFVENDIEKSKKYISSAYIFLSIIASLIIIVIIIISKFLSWNVIFSVSEEVIKPSTMNKAMIILLCSVVCQFLLNLIISISYALQKSFLPGLLNFTTNLIMFIFVTYCNYSKNNNDLIALSWANLLSVNLPLLCVTVFLFSRELKNMKPSIKFYNYKYAIDILKLGTTFLWLQLMTLVLNSTTIYLINNLIGNEYVVEYQLYFKVFNIVSTIMVLVITPIWSAVTKAKTEGKFDWLKKLYSKIKIIGGLFILFEFFIIIILQMFFDIWLGDKTIKVNYYKAFIFAIHGSLWIWFTIITYIVNGLEELKIQAIFQTLGAILMMVLSIIFVKFSKDYVSIMLANIISILPYILIQTIWLEKYIKRRSC